MEIEQPRITGSTRFGTERATATAGPQRILFPKRLLDRRFFEANAEFMGCLKTFIGCLAVVALTAGPLRAQDAPTRTFAECAGRFSAEMEHAWLTGDAAAAHFETQRATFVALLDASVPDTDRSRSLSYRIEAKVAHASLLSVATFGTKSTRAERARQLAVRHINRCQTLLLGG